MSTTNNLLATKDGKARFYKQVRSKARWVLPDVPVYEPFWVVRFHVCGDTWTQTANRYPWAQGQSAVRVWAAEVMRTRVALLQSGELEKLRAMRAPKKVVMLSAVIETYLANVPSGSPDYKTNALRLAKVWTEATGLETDQIAVTDAVMSRAALLGWVRMRQEFFRQGWTVKGAAVPANAWDVLRARLKLGALENGGLPGIDKAEEMAGNTTIKTYLVCAKAVFANAREYLVGLDLPELREFLKFSVSLSVPKGHRALSDEAVTAVWRDLPALKDASLPLWLLFNVLAYSGARPVTVKRLKRDALTMRGDGVGVLKLPATKRGEPVTCLLPADLASALSASATDASLLGAESATAARKRHAALNAWLRVRGVDGKHGAYMLRHRRGQQLRDVGGLQMSAAGLGHTSTAMAASTYTEERATMPMIDPETGREI